MQITSNLGAEIIKRIAKYTEVGLNIMDLNGKIVASTDKSRVGELHIGAVEVLKTGEELIIDTKKLEKYPGSKQGVNLPVKHNKKVAGVVGASGEPGELYQVIHVIRGAVEIVMEQITIERQAHFKERQWGYWLQQLLHPGGFDKEKLEEEAEYSLQAHIHSDWQIVVLQVKNGQDMLKIIRREIEGMKLDVLFALPFLENEIIIALPAVFERFQSFGNTLIKYASGQGRIGIGEAGYGLSGIRNSYIQAKQALLFAGEDSKISYSSSWQLERLIDAIDDEEYERISFEYEQLLEKLEKIYIDTIDIFFYMNFSIKKTADYLLVHRNTLFYRFERIHQKIGLNPRSFDDACILKIIRTKQICANKQNE